MRYVILACVLLLAAGCGSGPQQSNTLSGSEGVVIQILDVPSVVYENEEFPVTFELTNAGITGISEQDPGRIFVEVDELYLRQVRSVSRFPDNLFWLKPRNLYVDGETSYLTTYIQANPITRFSEEIRTPVLVSACYPYQSNITAEVCIEQSRVVDAGAIACRNMPVVPSTPGAPVGVSKIETRTYQIPDSEGGGVRPSFRITLSNLADGIPATGSCDPDTIQDGLGNVSIRAALLTDPLECVPSTVRLVRGQATVQCTLPDDSLTAGGTLASVGRAQGNYQSLLSVYLDYTYRISDRVEVRVTR